MEFGSIDGREDGEYSGIAFVEISEIFAMVAIFSRTAPINRVYEDPFTPWNKLPVWKLISCPKILHIP